MTEEEAKTKWCPFARMIVSEGGGAPGEPFNTTNCGPAANRYQINGTDVVGITPAMRCIGSACMAWRWDVPDPATYEGNAPGFCGLAGKP